MVVFTAVHPSTTRGGDKERRGRERGDITRIFGNSQYCTGSTLSTAILRGRHQNMKEPFRNSNSLVFIIDEERWKECVCGCVSSPSANKYQSEICQAKTKLSANRSPSRPREKVSETSRVASDLRPPALGFSSKLCLHN